MNEQEWKKLLDDYSKDSTSRSVKRAEILEKYRNVINEILHSIGQAWSSASSESDGLKDSQEQRLRYKLHYHYMQWRLTLWYGTYEYPYSIPDLLDADGEDFYHHDIKTFRPFNQRYIGIVRVTIVELGFRLYLEDSFGNMFLLDKLHQDITFPTIVALANETSSIVRKLETHPIHEPPI